jgi:hypothetical protein
MWVSTFCEISSFNIKEENPAVYSGNQMKSTLWTEQVPDHEGIATKTAEVQRCSSF